MRDFARVFGGLLGRWVVFGIASVGLLIVVIALLRAADAPGAVFIVVVVVVVVGVFVFQARWADRMLRPALELHLAGRKRASPVVMALALVGGVLGGGALIWLQEHEPNTEWPIRVLLTLLAIGLLARVLTRSNRDGP